VLEYTPSGGYFINPALPAGLNFDPNSGAISGRPLLSSPATDYTITAWNTSGHAPATVNITVNDKPNFSYAGPQMYLLNTGISPLSPTVKGNPVTAGFTISPALPAGLNFDKNTGNISGRPTVPSLAVNYIITATNTYGTATATVSITVNLVAPAIPATNLIFTNLTGISTTVNWTNGNGSSRAVFIKYNDGSAVPVANTTYTANTRFGKGSQIGASGWYCIYNGSGSSVNVTDLTASTAYRVTTVEYNGPAGGELYTTGGLSPANVVTMAIAPTYRARSLHFTHIGYNGATANWTNGSGQARAVFILKGQYGAAVPSDATDYTAYAAYGSGDQIAATGWYCIYNGSGSTVNFYNLTGNTTYRVTVVEYNESNGVAKYGTEGLVPFNISTLAPLYNNLYLAGTESKSPLVSSFSDEKVEAGNILSPNGDGVNDIWIVKNIAFYPNNTVTVYDRTGRAIFTAKNYANDWAGTDRGGIVTEGTYYYLIDLGNGKQLKGFITVVK
jgi:gliding motility-associated-like protein